MTRTEGKYVPGESKAWVVSRRTDARVPVDAVRGLGERAGAVEVPLDADDRATARGRVGFHGERDRFAHADVGAYRAVRERVHDRLDTTALGRGRREREALVGVERVPGLGRRRGAVLDPLHEVAERLLE